MSTARRLCLFCANHADSKEHIWARWMLPHLPKSEVLNHEVYSETIFPDSSKVRVRTRSGGPHSGRLRVVCANCNNGWMSDLQQEAKPHLLPLIRGEPYLLHRNAQRTLAAWITMFTMVAEHVDKTGTRIAIKQWEWEWLKDQRSVPPDWKIWIAHYERSVWKGVWVHNVIPILGEEDTPQRHHLGVDLPNTQCTTAVFGKLYVHSFSSRISRVVRKANISGKRRTIFRQLWPIRRRVSWPPSRAITDAEADEVATAVIRRATRVARASHEQLQPTPDR